MIGTHCVKAVDASIKQSAISADIIAPHSGNFISSQTVKMRRKFFAMPINAADMKKFFPTAREMLASDGIADPVLPDITSAKVKQVLLPYKGDYVAASPVISSGVHYELYQRIHEKWKANLGVSYWNWLVQPNASSLGNHGEAVMLQRGNFTLLPRLKINVEDSLWSGDFVKITARLERCNMNSGMLSTGLPAITAIGGMVHALEINSGKKIDFAFGVKKVFWHHGIPKIVNTKAPARNGPSYYAAEMLGSFDIVVILRSEGSLTSVARAARKITRLAGGQLFDINVSSHRDARPDAAAYVFDSSSDMEISLAGGDHHDSLDAAIDLNHTGPYYAISNNGYSFLEKPTLRKLARNGYPHAWVEPVFCLTSTSGLTNHSF